MFGRRAQKEFGDLVALARSWSATGRFGRPGEPEEVGERGGVPRLRPRRLCQRHTIVTVDGGGTTRAKSV